jgi:hypothetical protein
MPFIYPLALVFLYLCALFLSRFDKKSAPPPDALANAVPVPEEITYKSIFSAMAFCFSLLLATMAVVTFLQTRPVRTTHDLHDVPDKVGEWDLGTKDTLTNGLFSFYMGKPDVVLLKQYHRESGRSVSLFIARFDNQNTRKRISSISMPVFNTTYNTINLSRAPLETVSATLTDADYKNNPVSILSMFIINGVAYPNIGSMRKKTIENTVLKKRNDATFIAISVFAPAGSTDKESAVAFASLIYPYITHAIE